MMRSFFKIRTIGAALGVCAILGAARGPLGGGDVAAQVAADGAPGDRPNILLIVSDDQGWADLGSFGGVAIRTPNLDRLAREGVRLTQFYATAPFCTPSRGSILTGRYPHRNGTYELFRNKAPDLGHQYTWQEYLYTAEHLLGMDTREVLISEVLADAGYYNGIFGKWDLGQLRRYLPLQQGFHEFYGHVDTGIDYYTHERYGVHNMVRGNERTREDQGTYSTEIFRREATRFIRENHHRPFFLYVPFNAPHGSSNLDRDDPPVPAPEEFVRLYPDQDPTSNRTLYMAAVTAMDEAIGEMLDLLDEHGIADNTIVFFMSDNGGSGLADNGPLRGKKADLYEGGVRVPAIARWPGRIPAGTVRDAFLSALEIFPMLLSAVGAPPPEGVVLDGFDMLPILTGTSPRARQELFWQFRGERAARVGNWKWVEAREGEALFDLSRDISEQTDLSGERPEVLERLRREFSAWRAEMEAAEIRGPFRDF